MSKERRDTLGYILDLDSKRLLICISFDFFLQRGSNPDESIVIYPEQIKMFRQKIEEALLTGDNSNNQIAN